MYATRHKEMLRCETLWPTALQCESEGRTMPIALRKRWSALESLCAICQCL